MPIYEYRCEACGRMTESLQKVSEPPLVECPYCHRPALKRLVSATVFRLKGKGWYETDFKSNDRRNVYDSAGDEKVADAAAPSATPKAGEGTTPTKKDPAPAAASAAATPSKTSQAPQPSAAE